MGDGQRQSGHLHDYVAKLLRVKAENFKIKINQPQPSLPQIWLFLHVLSGL